MLSDYSNMSTSKLLLPVGSVKSEIDVAIFYSFCLSLMATILAFLCLRVYQFLTFRAIMVMIPKMKTTMLMAVTPAIK